MRNKWWWSVVLQSCKGVMLLHRLYSSEMTRAGKVEALGKSDSLSSRLPLIKGGWTLSWVVSAPHLMRFCEVPPFLPAGTSFAWPQKACQFISGVMEQACSEGKGLSQLLRRSHFTFYQVSVYILYAASSSWEIHIILLCLSLLSSFCNAINCVSHSGVLIPFGTCF